MDDNKFVILADLNGHVGSEAMGYEGIHGGWGYGTRNAEGERILEFALAMNMVICNTAFKKRESHLVTYRSGGSSSQIDYFLVRKSNRGLVKDTKVIPSEECVQQHKLLISDFRLRGGKTLGRKYVPRRRVWKLKEKRIKEAFYGELSICMEEQAAADSSVNEQYKALKGGLLKATDLVCGWTKGPPKHRVTWWWNEDVEAAIKEKRRLYKDYRKGGSRVEYEVAKRVAKREVYKAKSEAQRIWLDRLNGAEGRKEVFREAARVRKENRDIIGEQCVRNDSGRIVVDNEGLKEAWRAHYERLLNVEFEWDREGLAMVEPVLGPWPQIDEDTVRRALHKMKTGKAAGVSGLTSEMLNAAGDKGVVLMKDLINAIICECTIPDDWLRSIIVNVFKGKGDALDRGNYRGIKLLDQGMKVLERVLEGLIRDRVSIDGMQFGFMPGRGTTDAIFIVRQLQERFIERKKDLFFVFVDLEKAFDRVPREVIKWAMRKLGIEEWLVRVVMALYEGATTQVRVNGELSEEFPVNVGVHQGSVLSPLLFVMVLEAISRDFRIGLPWEALYADDLVLIAESREEVEEKLKRWKEGMEAKGLKINTNKTKVMISRAGGGSIIAEGEWPCSVCRKGVGRNSIMCKICGRWVHKRCSGIKGRLLGGMDFECAVCKGECVREREDRIDMLGESFDCVDEFCYLGDMISAGGGAGASSLARTGSGWKKFRELLPLLGSRGLSLRAKGQLYDACVRSAMVYGSETWAVKEGDICRLMRNEMKMVRWMCGVSLNDRREGVRITNEELRSRMGLECISEVVRRGRLRWYGHVERMDKDSWVSKVRSVNVEGSVGRGRPKKTWDEVVQADLRAKGLSREVAHDRAACRAANRGTRQTHASM